MGVDCCCCFTYKHSGSTYRAARPHNNKHKQEQQQHSRHQKRKVLFDGKQKKNTQPSNRNRQIAIKKTYIGFFFFFLRPTANQPCRDTETTRRTVGHPWRHHQTSKKKSGARKASRNCVAVLCPRREWKWAHPFYLVVGGHTVVVWPRG